MNFLINDFIDKEINKLAPPYEFMDEEPFCKYGYFGSGVCGGWFWNKNISDATNEEKLYMIAKTNEYWENWYEKRFYEHVDILKGMGYNDYDIYCMVDEQRRKYLKEPNKVD